MNEEKEKNNKLLSILITTFFIGIIIAATVYLAYATVRADYLPLSGDAWVHAYKVKFISEFWPNINWSHQWAAGMPLFLWYAILPYYLLLALAWFLKSIPLSISFWPAISIGLLGIGAFVLVYETTKSRIAGLIAALLTIPLPALWGRILVGEIPRMIGYGFITLSMWSVVRFIKIYQEKGEVDIKNYILTIIFVSLSLQGHVIPMVFSVFINGLIIFFCLKTFREKFKVLFKIFVPATLLAGYFIIPYFLTQHVSQIQSASFFGSFEVYPATLKHFFWIPPFGEFFDGTRLRPVDYGGLSPLHLPLLFIFFILFIFQSRKLAKLSQITQKLSLNVKLIWALFLITIFFILFGVAIYLGWPNTWYNTALLPNECFYLLALVLPSLLALLFYFLFNKWHKVYLILSIVMIIILSIWIKIQYPFRFPYKDQSHRPDSLLLLYHWESPDDNPIYKLLKNDLDEKQFRVGISDSPIAGFFNFDYDLAQTRDFYSQGLLYPDWRAWQENAIWNWNNYSETRFLLDWFSIKWILFPQPYCENLTDQATEFALTSCSNLEKFRRQPEDYQFLEFKPSPEGLDLLRTLTLKKPAPILSATNAPSMLILGKQEVDVSYGQTKRNKYETYSPIFRSLAFTNFNSQKLIPVLGKEYIDDYKLDELSKFKSIFLYQYKFHNQDKAFKLLNQYVNNGGGLIIEISGTKEATKMKELPDPFPINHIQTKERNKDWNFKPEDHFITKNIDFSKFSDALYNKDPWKISTTNKEDIKNGTKPLLYSDGEPVVIAEELGQGRVIWSGLSLPYHTISNKNPEEARFLENIIRWVTKTDQTEELTQASYQANFINPQKREVILNDSATGVLFKENYFMDWNAYLIRSDGKKEKTKIYDAGTDFMYVPLSKGVEKVIFEYKLSWIEKTSIGISIITLIWLIYLLFFGKPINTKLPLVNRPTLKLKNKFKKFWEDEENY